MSLLIIGCLLLGLAVSALAIDKAELDKRIRSLADSRFNFGGEASGTVGGGNACGGEEQNEQIVHTAKHGFLSAPLIGQKQPHSDTVFRSRRK